MPSKKELVVMSILIRPSPMYGLEIVRESDGDVTRGSVYTILNRLIDKGFVESEEREFSEFSQAKRRVYKLTGEGRRVIDFCHDLSGKEEFA